MFFSVYWFRLGILTIFLVSLFLRFWQLEQFNTLVFDEVYYAKFANNYLTRTPFFNSHPPLSQYIIAIGIWLGSHFSTSPDLTNDLTGSWRSTISYRWLNALTGSFIPLVVGAIAYQLTPRRSYTLIVTLLAASDGLFLVESRYALNNIYLVIFGLLGQLFFLISINNKKAFYLTISGLFFGASAGIKWNGLGFLLGIYLIIGIAWSKKTINYVSNKLSIQSSFLLAITQNFNRIESKIFNFNPSILLFNLIIIPLFFYTLLWFPHIVMNPDYGVIEVHQKIWSFHQAIKDGSTVHPYCSKWYSWLLMIRPIAYFYKVKETEFETIIYDVHAMGNPILWWFSTGAIFSLVCLAIRQVFKSDSSPSQNSQLFSFILINYSANLLPWIGVSRCTFLYHYMGSYVFSWLALAWIIEQCLISHLVGFRRIGITIIILILLAFVFWMPIYLGLPLSQHSFKLRLFLPTWL